MGGTEEKLPEEGAVVWGEPGTRKGGPGWGAVTIVSCPLPAMPEGVSGLEACLWVCLGVCTELSGN